MYWDRYNSQLIYNKKEFVSQLVEKKIKKSVKIQFYFT